METLCLPTDEEIGKAYDQGQEAVVALFYLAGKNIPDKFEGRVLPGLGGSDRERSIFSVEAKENSSYGRLAQATIALVKGNYKLIHYTGYPKKPELFELYNLKDDIDEMKDLFLSDTVTAARMKQEPLDVLADADRPYIRK